MVRIRTISTLLLSQIEKGERRRLKFSTNDLKEAFEVARKVYLDEGERPYGASRGPPGVGKTTIAEAVMIDSKIEEALRESNTVFLYEAPTNELVISAFERLLSLTVHDCDTAKEFLRSVRLYGSLLPPPFISESKDELLRECTNISPDMLREVVGGRITEDVKIAISTEFQRVSARLKTKKLFSLFVDEASTSPLYLPYTPLSDLALKDLMEESRGVLRHLFVVGDERQAIGLEEAYRYNEQLLILPKVRELLEEEGLVESLFKHIGITLRLPEPTERPLHKGFYEELGGLRAYYKFYERVNTLQLNQWRERWGKCNNIDIPFNVLKTVEQALSSSLPLIVINTKESYPPSERVEPYRVKLAIGLAALFRCLYPQLEIAVVGPYQDLVLVAKVNYYSKYGRFGHVYFATINTMLGKEADIVIAMLGKERYGEGDMHTIYFQDPNLLNVQLSRHRAMLIIVGDAIRLRNVAARIAKVSGIKGERREAEKSSMIRKTIDTLLSLSGVEITKQSRSMPTQRQGVAGVFLNIGRQRIKT
jgi:hypothetical protein